MPLVNGLLVENLAYGNKIGFLKPLSLPNFFNP